MASPEPAGKNWLIRLERCPDPETRLPEKWRRVTARSVLLVGVSQSLALPRFFPTLVIVSSKFSRTFRNHGQAANSEIERLGRIIFTTSTAEALWNRSTRCEASRRSCVPAVPAAGSTTPEAISHSCRCVGTCILHYLPRQGPRRLKKHRIIQSRQCLERGVRP